MRIWKTGVWDRIVFLVWEVKLLMEIFVRLLWLGQKIKVHTFAEKFGSIVSLGELQK